LRAVVTLLVTTLLFSAFLLEFLVEGADFLAVRTFFSMTLVSVLIFDELLYADIHCNLRAKLLAHIVRPWMREIAGKPALAGLKGDTE
jgi:hypothetical protein